MDDSAEVGLTICRYTGNDAWVVDVRRLKGAELDLHVVVRDFVSSAGNAVEQPQR
ncbi:hypothetical protein D3C86_1915930 [compost metagenome]